MTTIIENFRGFEIGSTEKLSLAQKEALLQGIQRAPESSLAPLSGRVRPHGAHIEGLGKVIIKHYHRGGLLWHVNRRTYLRAGSPRCRTEFEMLARVRAAGVNAPRPIAFASLSRHFIFYHAWLVTREVPGARTLAEISRSAPEQAPAQAMSMMPALTAQVGTLIRHGILHVDLHPGNVLADEDGRVYLIDFDRAHISAKSREGIAGFYLERWHRAVAKHDLPGFLSESFSQGLKNAQGT